MMLLTDVCYGYLALGESEPPKLLKGNPGFKEFLCSIAGYAERREQLCAAARHTSGRPIEKDYDEEIEPMVGMVCRLYEANGLRFDSDAQNTFRKTLQAALQGESNFFDLEKGKYWVDLLSGMEREFHVFSGSESGCDFATFYARLSTACANFKQNKQVAFYIRWVSGLAALYTIYTKQPYPVYERVRDDLKKALEQGIAQKGKKACKPDMGTHLIKNNLFVYLLGKEDPDEICQTIREFVVQNPGQFIPGSGRVSKRYRRYYELIADLLDAIAGVPGGTVAFERDEELLSLFRDPEGNRTRKDRKLHHLEYCLIKQMDQWFDDGTNTEDLLEALVGPGASFKVSTLGKDTVEFPEVVIEKVDNKRTDSKFYEQRDPVDVVDNIVKLLRLYFILVKVEVEVTNPYGCDRLDVDELVNQINCVMSRLGLATLPLQLPDTCTKESAMDWFMAKTLYSENALEALQGSSVKLCRRSQSAVKLLRDVQDPTK